MTGSNAYTYALILGLGTFYGLYSGRIHSNSIPSAEKVQAGYAIPKNLEIKLKDLDGNGMDEVLLNYKGKSYLLREVNNKPVISEYEISISSAK
jgi:hypothetical protein